jgi:DNA-binding SARP family transcriptional activator
MIEISLFGTTTVRTSSGAAGTVTLPGGKPRQILEILATVLGSPVSKDELADRLWDGRPPSSYLASVESYVCVLRRSLSGGTGTPLLTTRRGYLLDPRLVRVDLVEVHDLLASAELAAGDVLLSGAERALAELPGRLLADEPYADWADVVRRCFDEQVELVATRAAEECLARGDAGAAVRLARRAVQHGPFSEPACRALMRAYDAAGSKPQALEVYADLRSMMTRELGVEPSPETQAVYLAALAGERSGPPNAGRSEAPTLVRLLIQAVEAGERIDLATRSGLVALEALLVQRTA